MSELENATSEASENTVNQDFLRTRISEDIKNKKFDSRVHTRFPPEPNGYLHLGHAKSICLNFGLAKEYNGKCNLRFDDTNPVKEDTEYVDAIMEDVKWLGFDWDSEVHYASDYFDELYAFAEQLILSGKAYVDAQSPDEIRETRGTLTKSGTESPYRNRSVEENLDIFRRMKKGEFPDGTYVLRAKIDMSAPNIVMRDPTLYRIRHAHHHRTGDKWCIYPMYDFTHCISDSLEKITHSVCTLEFVNNRELYDWTLDALNIYHPDQIEFARLNISHTMLSKRKLIACVQEKLVDGWDDPRMPTLCGLRRRGVTPKALRNFCERIGLAKVADSQVEYAMLDFCVREDLNATTPRYMAVLDPLKVVITNYPEQSESFDLPLYPDDDSFGSRLVPFSRELYIEREDFMENPSKKYFRLAPNQEVRLRYAYYITCNEVIKDANGEISELRCTYDPETKGGQSPDGRKVKGTIHWVSAKEAKQAEVHLYEQLFLDKNPASQEADLKDILNPNSKTTITAFIEPALATLAPKTKVQFERLAYFCVDYDSQDQKPIFNRTVTLKDSK